MTIYIDPDYKCYVENADGLIAIETEFFNGKCKPYIEGYRFIPSGKTWVRSDGAAFIGEMIMPCKNFSALDAAQREYERQQLEQLKSFISTTDWGELAGGSTFKAGDIVRYGTSRYSAKTDHTKAQSRSPGNLVYWEVVTDGR